MSKIILVTLPSSDRTTRYISTWAQLAIHNLKSKNFKLITLEKERAVKIVFESMVHKHAPTFIFLNGHGGSDLVCGQNNEILIQEGKNELILKGTISYALSCSSAKVLGPSAITAGATSYIGYKEDFIFFISSEKRTKPQEDKTAEMFLAPANQIVVSLVKGHTVAEAIDMTKKYFLK